MEKILELAAATGSISFIQNTVEAFKKGDWNGVGAALISIVLGCVFALAALVATGAPLNPGVVLLAGVALGGNASNAHDLYGAISRRPR